MIKDFLTLWWDEYKDFMSALLQYLGVKNKYKTNTSPSSTPRPQKSNVTQIFLIVHSKFP